MLLKKQYLISLSLFSLMLSLHGETLNEHVNYNKWQRVALTPDIFENHEYNINKMVEVNYFSMLMAKADFNELSSMEYIEKVAKSKLGKTYKWGGNGPYTYDCSGFTKEVFELNGIKIPRVSKDQAKVGKKVTKKNLKKGDLIFFDDKESSAVSHVGIYLGKGEFIHASRFHKQIVISPLREYRRFFKWGRRLI
jgi:hypothetical protein